MESVALGLRGTAPERGSALGDHDRERRLAEMHDRLAVVLASVGFPRPIARVYAALTLAETDGLATSQLIDRLALSKASISNAMQFLVGTGLVEKYHVRGSRETHYRMLKGTWGPMMTAKLKGTAVVRQTAQEALELVESDAARERLTDMHDVYAFFEEEFEGIMRRWDERTDVR